MAGAMNRPEVVRHPCRALLRRTLVTIDCLEVKRLHDLAAPIYKRGAVIGLKGWGMVRVFTPPEHEFDSMEVEVFFNIN